MHIHACLCAPKHVSEKQSASHFYSRKKREKMGKESSSPVHSPRSQHPWLSPRALLNQQCPVKEALISFKQKTISQNKIFGTKTQQIEVLPHLP